MDVNISHIIDHFFQQQALDDVDVKDIEQVKEKYPYYAPVQYLLAKKYRQLGADEQYAAQEKMASLYFVNPHWYYALLHPEELPADETAYTKIDNTVATTIVENDMPVENTGEQLMPEDVPVVEVVEQKFIIEENIFPSEVEPVVNVETNAPVEPVVEDTDTKTGDTALREEEPLPAVEIKESSTIIEEPAVQAATEEAQGDGNAEEDIVAAAEEERLSADVKLPTGDFSLAEAKAAFDQPLPGNENNAVIPIEPLHTVDYFASQGIKLGNEYEGKDKLSQKLKSFTEWLKTMKKIHPEKFETAIDGNTQATIQHIAEHSNEQKDVITEAMAEVYARQGLTRKAVETYQKLSLLNPDKRVYFAAKISKLKEN